MSDVDFNNGFICGLAVKGTADGDGGNKPHKCVEIMQLDDFNLIYINTQIIITSDIQTNLKEVER